MRQKQTSLTRFWLQGIRLYIAIAIFLITLESWWWASVSYGGELSAIRLEELFAWLSVLLLVSVLLIGPIYKIFPKARAKQIVFDSRRMIGVGAAWFALLHVVIVYDKLFKLSNPIYLPDRYRLSSLIGLIALLILLTMMATSFDVAQKYLKIWWFRIHRYIYLGAGFVLLHTFMIGSHALKPITFISLVVIAVAIYIGESLAVILPKKPASKWQILALSLGFTLLVATIGYGILKYQDNNSVGDARIVKQNT